MTQFIHDCYIKLDSLDIDFLGYNIYYFELSYTDILLYEKSLREFQKFIMQQTELIDGYIAPTIYIIYEIYYVKKSRKYLKTDRWPKIKGHIFTNSLINPEHYYKIYHGMKRYNAKLTIDIINSSKPLKFNDPIILVCNNYKHYKSLGERKCQEILSKNKFITNIECQYVIPECANINPLPFDFKCTLINNDYFLLEYQGEQHFKSIKMWGGVDGLKTRQLNDSIKKNFCEKNNIKLLTINYYDYKNLNKIINEFIDELTKDDEDSEIELYISLDELIPINHQCTSNQSDPVLAIGKVEQPDYWSKFLK